MHHFALLLGGLLLARGQSDGWITRFAVEKGALVSRGRGVYFILEPGRAQVYEANGQRLVITVLHETPGWRCRDASR